MQKRERSDMVARARRSTSRTTPWTSATRGDMEVKQALPHSLCDVAHANKIQNRALEIRVTQWRPLKFNYVVSYEQIGVCSGAGAAALVADALDAPPPPPLASARPVVVLGAAAADATYRLVTVVGDL